MATKVFTHKGIISGDARNGGRSGFIKLRKTPSGSHWVDAQGRKYRINGGGYVGHNWPLWYLDAETIVELEKSA